MLGSGASLSRNRGSQCGRLWERVEKGLRGLQISRVETFGEAVVDRPEERHPLRGTALFAQQPGEAGGGPQLAGKGALPARPVEDLPEGRLCT